MSNETKCFLDAQKINYIATPFNKEVFTVAGVAEVLAIEEGQVVKTMIVKNKQLHYWGVVLPGNKKLDFKWVQGLLGEKKLTFASPAEVKKLLGYEVGAVSPISLIIKKIKVILDYDLLTYTNVNIASGDHTLGYDINTADLYNFILPVLVNKNTIVSSSRL